MSTSNTKEWQNEQFKQNMKRNHSLFTNKHTSHVTKAAGIEVFMVPKNESTVAGTNRLGKDRSWKSGSVQERSLSKLALDVDVLCLVPV